MLSKVGIKLSELSGVRKIMNDITNTIKQSGGQKLINMSAGNPLVLDELINLWEKHTRKIIDNKEFGTVIGRYGSTKGYEGLLKVFPKFFKDNFGKDITDDNLLVTGGTQALYFYVINAYAGVMEDGTRKKIFLPQCPDYTGYVGMAIDEDMFISSLQKTEKTGKHQFKYVLDTSKFPNKDEVGAILLSRPCNPTGNVISDEEMEKIYDYVKGTDIPVFIDSAYAPPIPNLCFTEINTKLNENVIYCMSFSKAGIPGERVGVAIGDKKYLKPLEAFEANATIMSSRFGQALVASALESGELLELAKNVINPYYKKKFELINEKLNEFMPDDISWYVHESKGSMFTYLWFENLPISDEELYEILKKERILFVPGNPFFTGVDKSIKHTKECMRLSITVPDEDIIEAIKVFAKVIKDVYK